MKKLLSMFLVVVMMFSTISLSVFASNAADVVIVGAEITAKPGETVEIPIIIEQNNGFCGLNLHFEYSDLLTFVSLKNVVSSLTCTNSVTTVWDGADDYTGTGNLAVLTFTVPTTSEYGTKYTIQINFIEAYDIDLNDVSVLTSAASITVVCSHSNTTNMPETLPDCDEGGYTAGVYCNDCETYISGHEPMSATGNHTDADGQWESNEDRHFRTCDCGHIFDSADHSGGTATCSQKAVCSTCEEEYGAVNSDNHAGGTTTIRKLNPDHKTQTDGYSGDVKCLGCSQIITYGQVIKADEHVSANSWSFDDTYHWKICSISECGIAIDDTKEQHISTGSNVATCQKQAVCDICHTSYGDLASHDYTAEEKNTQALKSPGDCCNYAAYYYSCSVCGNVEHNDDHVFFGDKAIDEHIGGTIVVNDSSAEHQTQTPGYTGDTKCLGCDRIISYGQTISPGAHTADNVWSSNETHHWKECAVDGCGVEIDDSRATHASTGSNTATCIETAKCDICNTSYGNTTDHDWENTYSNDDSEHWYECAECEAQRDNAIHSYSSIGYSNNCHWHECECGAKLASEEHSGGIADCDNKAKCEVCQQEYGNIMHDTVYVSRVEATEEEDGNIEHWYCEECSSYFADAACAIEISYENTIIKYKELTNCNMSGHKFITFAVDESVHAKICTNKCGVIISALHSFGLNHICRECGMMLNVTDDEDIIVIEEPIEPATEESEEAVANNPKTGIACSLLQLTLCAALAMFKRR